MSRRVIAWIGWALATVTTVLVVYAVIDGVRSGAFEGDEAALLDTVVFGAFGVLFAVLGALIISKQPGNVIGCLLVTPALGNAISAVSTIYLERRLFRSRCNAQLVIERFGGAAQNQADLELLSADVLAVVEQTIQPRFGRLWIRGST